MKMVIEFYKQFRVRNGKLYPLFVRSDEETPVGVWVKAKDGERTADGKVKSKLGKLAYRPGFHLADIPYAGHIGRKDKSGNISEAHPDTVWCLCEVLANKDYNGEARENGWHGGKWSAKRAQLDHIPEDGYYFYKTNPKMKGVWCIAGTIKVIRPLTYAEEIKICAKYGITAQKRTNPVPYVEWKGMRK